LVGQAWKLYYLLRGLDQTGCGYAQINLSEAARILKAKLPTIRAYLQKLKANSIINVVSLGHENYRVYYISLFNLAAKANLTSFGACGTVPLTYLSAGKFVAAELVAKFLQRQSIRKAACKHGPQAIASTDQILSKSSSDLSVRAQDTYKGKIIGRSSRYVYVNSRFIPIGGSQDKIAELLNCSQRTVSTLLSNSARQHQGLDPLNRIQICQRIEADPLKVMQHLDEHGSNIRFSRRGFIRSIQDSGKVQVWLPTTNVYADSQDQPVQLSSMQQRRTRYVRYVRNRNLNLTNHGKPAKPQPYDSNMTPDHNLLSKVFAHSAQGNILIACYMHPDSPYYIPNNVH